MSDKESLELAAKAAGLNCFTAFGHDGPIAINENGKDRLWNPLADDGDALRLAVKLGIHIKPIPAEHILAHERKYTLPHTQTCVGFACCVLHELHNDDPCAASRLAIVRAAAAIGKAIQ